MRSRLVYFVVTTFFALSACLTTDEKASAAKHDKQKDKEEIQEANEFLTEVATGVYKEVELSRLALQKASITKVKEFAKNMITDYDKNIEGLKELAGRKNLQIVLKEDDELKEQIKKLSGLEGVAFDKEYIKMMVKDHEEDVEKFNRQVRKGRDIETKAFASGKLNILRHHLDMAKTLYDSIERS
jgi:putative membrane protein